MTMNVEYQEQHVDGWQAYWDMVVAPVPGWLNSWEGEALSALARQQAPRGPVVEIGCYRGRSTLCLGHGVQSAFEGHLWSVDLFEDTYTFEDCPSPLPSEDALRQLLRSRSLEDTVTVVRGDSRADETAAAVPGDIALLFVDGDHVYDTLVAEWNIWGPKLSAGAVVAFHDYDNIVVGDGVSRFCDGVIRDQFDGITVCDRFKREPNAIPGGLFVAQQRSVSRPIK